MHVRGMRILIVLCVLAAFPSSNPAQARSHRVLPNPCPASSDASAGVPDRDVSVNDIDIAPYVGGVVQFDAALPGASAAGRLFKRFALDPRTGRLVGPDRGPAAACR